MIVVADTSPLCYLVLIGEERVLPLLYARILLTATVLSELRHPQAPEILRTWSAEPPSWLELHSDPTESNDVPASLHAGERTAILLARSMRADFVLMDEAAGRDSARACGVPVVGTFGVLRHAADMGLLDFKATLLRLRGTSFRASPALWNSLLGPASNP
jgi:predicted nucleic acid-binding protein